MLLLDDSDMLWPIDAPWRAAEVPSEPPEGSRPRRDDMPTVRIRRPRIAAQAERSLRLRISSPSPGTGGRG